MKQHWKYLCKYSFEKNSNQEYSFIISTMSTKPTAQASFRYSTSGLQMPA